MSPRVSEEYTKIRRQEVLTATWELFAEQGYHATTMRDVAAKIGVTTGVIYKYFSGKEEITQGISELSRESRDKLFDTMAQKSSAYDALDTFLDAVFASFPFEDLRKSSVASINVWAESRRITSFHDVVQKQFIQLSEQLSGFVSSGVAHGELREDLDPVAMANFYITLMIGMQVQSAMNDQIDFEKFYGGIKEILLRDIWRTKVEM